MRRLMQFLSVVITTCFAASSGSHPTENGKPSKHAAGRVAHDAEA